MSVFRIRKIENKHIHREVRHNALVEKLKDELCRFVFMKQEEECLEVDDIMK